MFSTYQNENFLPLGDPSKNIKIPPNYKLDCGAKYGPKSTYPPVGEKCKKVDRAK
jgi:hypothetical protein